MSFSNPSFPTQKTVYSQINNVSDLKYVENQSNLLKSQKQQYIGHIPPYIQPTTNDSIIQNVRYGCDNSQKQNVSNTRINMQDEGPNKPNKEYNPYIDYLFKKGLLNDNYKTRVFTNYINIDSKSRRIEPELTKTEEILLSSNSLSYSSIIVNASLATAKLNLLTINIPKHSFEVGNRITITGVLSEPVSVKALYNFTQASLVMTGHSIIFEQGKNSMIVKCDYTESVIWNGVAYAQDTSPTEIQNMSFNPNFVVGDGIPYTTLKGYDTSNMYVSITGFIGDFIGANISTNFLNSTHRIYLTNPDSTGDTLINITNGSGVVEKITGFYILLPEPFIATTTPALDPTIYKDMVITINFEYIGGIPFNTLNANLPITNANINGYQTIYSITRDTISIKLNKDTYYIEPTPKTKPEIGQVQIKFGLDNMYVALVNEIIAGSQQPNNYIIDLPKAYHNVIMVRLISTIFPNISRLFRKSVNNKIYWQNLDDGEYVYNTEISEGNYTTAQLETELQTKMFAVTRIGISDNVSQGYTNKILFKINIDANTNIASFTSYKQAKLRQPIINITPTPPIGTTPGTPPYIIQIYQPGHGLSVDEEVLFEGFITTLGIPDGVLNTTHTIKNIIDVDNYEIEIDNFNLTYVRVDEKGGYACKVLVRNSFRLLFNSNDTMGTQLGFRKVGSDIAITQFNTTITNQQAYQNEITTYDPSTKITYVSDGSGKLVELTNNALQLNSGEYIIIVVREFSGCDNICGNKQLTKYFAKINLKGITNQYVFDEFISPQIIFYDMINLSTLNLSFYDLNGVLYDFNGVDHSFVIEITTLDLLPQETGINSTNNFI